MVEILYYYDGPRFGWVVTCHDAEGNQLWDAQYFPNKRALAEAFGGHYPI
jgi:hypothetical protein